MTVQVSNIFTLFTVQEYAAIREHLLIWLIVLYTIHHIPISHHHHVLP